MQRKREVQDGKLILSQDDKVYGYEARLLSGSYCF